MSMDMLRLLNEYRNGRVRDLANGKFLGSLSDVPDFWAILIDMPSDKDAVLLKDIPEGQEAPKRRMIRNCFSYIGTMTVHGQQVVGPVWDVELRHAMPFPSKEMASEFSAKILEMPDAQIIQVKDLIKTIK